VLPEAGAYLEGIVRDLATRYALDGVHLDYARYPTDRFDYSRAAIARFRAAVRPTLSEARRRSLDGAEAVDLFAYPDALPAEWRAFRVERMTALVARLRDAVKSQRPMALVTSAVAPDARDAYDHRLQDWREWVNTGLVDAICPMAYTTDAARFAEQIAAVRAVAGSRPVWAGIGAYRLSPAQTIDNIRTARRLGADGIVLFSYDSLIDPRQAAPDYLSVVGRAAFAAPIPSAPGGR